MHASSPDLLNIELCRGMRSLCYDICGNMPGFQSSEIKAATLYRLQFDPIKWNAGAADIQQPDLQQALKNFLTQPFKIEEWFHLKEESDWNDLFKKWFDVKEVLGPDFLKVAQHSGNHSAIMFARIEGVVLDDKEVEAIAFAAFEPEGTGIYINDTEVGIFQGLLPPKPSKSMVVLNVQAEDGYLILCQDRADGWKSELQPCQDAFHQTKAVLQLAKSYVTSQLSEEFEVSRADQIDLLNRSMAYFKSNEEFHQETFEKEVFQHPSLIQSYRNFKDQYEPETEIQESFAISEQAVKRGQTAYKSVLKLDRNFHIYIHGNRNLIEQGTDPDGRKFYKIYFKEEH